jgi:hypothetical protein
MRLSPSEAAERGQYRAISRLAVVALVLGLASALAPVHAVLWVVPAIGTAVAVAALRSISRSSQALVGRQAALAGLALAVFFGVCAPARLISQRIVTAREAREFAEYWLGLVRAGRLLEAHQWTENPLYRAAGDVDLKEFYDADRDAKQRLNELFRAEPLRTLAQQGASGELRFVRTLSAYGTTPKKARAVQHFQVRYGNSADPPLAIRMIIERTESENGTAQWQVMEIGPL